MNTVKLKIIILLLFATPAINSAFAANSAPTDTISVDSVRKHLEHWQETATKDTSNANSIWQKRGGEITIDNKVTSDTLLKKQIDSLFNGIEGIYKFKKNKNDKDTCLIRKHLSSNSGEKMHLPKNDTVLQKAIVTLFKITKGELSIQKPVKTPSTPQIDNLKFTDYIPYIIIILLVLILGILYKLFMSKSKNAKPKQRNASLQKKTERPDNNLQEISILKTRLDRLEAVRPKNYEAIISEMNKKLTELESSIKKMKESMTAISAPKPATPASTPTPYETQKTATMQYYFATPQTDTFAVKVPQTDYDAFWVVEVANENAQTGTYKVNDNKKNQLLTNAELYLKPFLEIQNMNEVSRPTRIEYLSNGTVTRTAEGYWKITEKANVKLL